MCGRYTLSKAENLKLKLIEAGFDFDEFSMTRITPRFNIAPTQTVPVIFNQSPRQLSLARWGLLPFWAKDEKIGASLINARSETVATKPAFRSAFKKRRCLIPADGFYEWQKTPGGKLPHRFTLKDGDLFSFAGLWEEWTPPGSTEPLRTCSIITTQANELVAPVHDRMPVILPKEQESTWLASETTPEALSALLVPYPASAMQDTMVSPLVNNARNDNAELIVPMNSN